MHPGCAEGQGQRSRDTRTLDSWNELAYSVIDGLVRLQFSVQQYRFKFVNF